MFNFSDEKNFTIEIYDKVDLAYIQKIQYEKHIAELPYSHIMFSDTESDYFYYHDKNIHVYYNLFQDCHEWFIYQQKIDMVQVAKEFAALLEILKKS
jgi:hypothetical protein